MGCEFQRLRPVGQQAAIILRGEVVLIRIGQIDRAMIGLGEESVESGTYRFPRKVALRKSLKTFLDIPFLGRAFG